MIATWPQLVLQLCELQSQCACNDLPLHSYPAIECFYPPQFTQLVMLMLFKAAHDMPSSVNSLTDDWNLTCNGSSIANVGMQTAMPVAVYT